MHIILLFLEPCELKNINLKKISKYLIQTLPVVPEIHLKDRPPLAGNTVWMQNFKEPEGQLARWLEKLQEYTTSLFYIAKALNTPMRTHCQEFRAGNAGGAICVEKKLMTCIQ